MNGNLGPGGASGAAIVADGVAKAFGKDVVVHDLTFAVPAGAIVGLIGPSGCGKTTTIRLMNGAYEPTEGRLEVLGRTPSTMRRAARQDIGYLPQQPVLFAELSVRENLNFHASLYGVRLRRRRRLRELLDLVELTEHRRKRVADISGGMQRRAALAAALVHDPHLLFLDEPTAGIDPILRQKLWERFRALRDDGRTLVVSTQYVGEAAYCDLVAVMAAGRIVAFDTPDGLRRSACGGELVDIETVQPIPDDVVDGLGELACTTAPPVRLGSRTVRCIVTRAETGIPECLHWLESRPVEVRTVREHVPDFDDVFVRIVEQAA